MAPIHVRLSAALAGVALFTSLVSAQQAVGPGTAVKGARPAKSTAMRAARTIQSLINGVAVDSDQSPLPSQNIRLRNLEANAVEQTAITNGLGEFTFVARPTIPYVVEIADQDGRIVAVGDVIVPNPGEVTGSVVAVPGRVLPGTFSDTASAVKSAATDSGLTVVDPALPEVSPRK